MKALKKRTEVLTLREAAGYLRVSADMVRNLAQKGDLPGRMIGGEWRFLRTALADWLAVKPDARTRLLRHAGVLANDEQMPSLLRSIYRERGRPMRNGGGD
jgi:excisionase family DNA binding protein